MPQASQRMQIGVEYMENSCPLARQEGSSRAAEPSALTTACSLQQQQFRDTSSAPLHRELAQAVSIAIMSRLSNSVLSLLRGYLADKMGDCTCLHLGKDNVLLVYSCKFWWSKLPANEAYGLCSKGYCNISGC